MQLRRVAVTGIGAICALGNNFQEFRSALAAARSGVRALPSEIAMGSGVQVGALATWDPAAHFKGPEAAALDRVSQFALTAAGEAIAASKLDLQSADRNRIGVCWGTGMGGAHTLETAYSSVYGRNDFRLRPLSVVMAMNNAAGSNVAVKWGLRGPFANFSTACSSSAMAIGEAVQAIGLGRADAMIAGGAEALLTPGMLAAWQALRTLSPADAADASASCKPFDKRRGGLVLGEGAAALVLEEESRARARRDHPRHHQRLRQFLRRRAHVQARPRRPGARHARSARAVGPGAGCDRLHQCARHRDHRRRRGRVRSNQDGVRRRGHAHPGELDQVDARPSARRRRRPRDGCRAVGVQ
jgi:3-oxoacyl-[acyl-carrier-protein] synthase II